MGKNGPEGLLKASVKILLEVYKLLCYLTQWYAIALSIVGDYEGQKAKLQNAYVMKEHFEVSAEVVNNVFITYHFLALVFYPSYLAGQTYNFVTLQCYTRFIYT